MEMKSYEHKRLVILVMFACSFKIRLNDEHKTGTYSSVTSDYLTRDH